MTEINHKIKFDFVSKLDNNTAFGANKLIIEYAIFNYSLYV